MAIEVVPLTEADIPDAIEIIQSAFAEDPYFKWVFDAANFNKERNHDSLAVRCRWGINNAIFQVSCWLPPHSPSEPESWYTWSQGWLLTARQALNNLRHWGRGGLRTNRYWIWKARQHEAQSQIWDDPKGYYFCNIVAVRPGTQGKGIGRKLFEAVTDKADQEGVKCYLESSRNEPNVRIYEKMGFEMKKEMECRDGEDVCMLYCMVRKPRSKY
ncbi:GNAT family N-acetyltransferase [Aspergillus aculeatinus CBS 121060]|uniref:Acetyltransferase, GNAT family n=1 Tax=Aspergillus aculeatinus CBS 121060 TaxID=1448322 RepID=A0ACD1GWH8_9EURO|nr:acetyltransferase, GNAT family [Aspergillus aculeatinus CBS 121060]RAH65691.1 acetyltransferase, GNAT family [Aspergillus aculeatinus CBS 121060]